MEKEFDSYLVGLVSLVPPYFLQQKLLAGFDVLQLRRLAVGTSTQRGVKGGFDVVIHLAHRAVAEGHVETGWVSTAEERGYGGYVHWSSYGYVAILRRSTRGPANRVVVVA